MIMTELSENKQLLK